MGVLAMTAVWGFRYAMDKQKANQLYNEAKLAYISVGANGPYDWTQTEFNSATGLTLFVRQDKAGGIFVLAETVPNGVCNRISDMAEDGQEVVLYTPMNEPVDCGAEKLIVRMVNIVTCDGPQRKTIAPMLQYQMIMLD